MLHDPDEDDLVQRDYTDRPVYTPSNKEWKPSNRWLAIASFILFVLIHAIANMTDDKHDPNLAHVYGTNLSFSVRTHQLSSESE